MFIELIDKLRCPNPHELTWLVAAIESAEDRDVISATLGCPICHATYPIVRGIADFSGGAAIAHAGLEPATMEETMRLAALLDLATPGGFVALTGAWTALAPALHVTTDVHVLVIDPVDAM